MLVHLDLLPPNVDNGTITAFDVYLGTVDARLNASAQPHIDSLTNKVRKIDTLHIFSGVKTRIVNP